MNKNPMHTTRVLVDMSCTLIHHGHIRLINEAKKLGKVIVGLTTDEEILNKKGYLPELNFSERKEILISLKNVDTVIPAPWLIDDDFIIDNNIQCLVHGSDNSNKLSSCDVILFERTEGISSTILRSRACEIVRKLEK